MGKPNRATQEKRRRERAKAEKKEEKRQKRAERKVEKELRKQGGESPEEGFLPEETSEPVTPF